jgi:hypothetical protein
MMSINYMRSTHGDVTNTFIYLCMSLSTLFDVLSLLVIENRYPGFHIRVLFSWGA